MSSNQQPVTLLPLSEQDFMNQMIEKMGEGEKNAHRIYSDPVGIPTMGIGKALALRDGKLNGDNQYKLMDKVKIEGLVRQATGKTDYTMPDQEYVLLERSVAHANSGKIEEAQKLIPAYSKKSEPDTDNKFGFSLPAEGARRLAAQDVTAARGRALAVYRAEAKALGWSAEQTAAYEGKLKTSPQMMALTSMQYNAVAAPKATRAVLEGNPAEAYKEIVYRSNGGQSKSSGIANRRLEEGRMVLDGLEPKTEQDRQAWQTAMDQNKDEITAYERLYPKAFRKGDGRHDLSGKPITPDAANTNVGAMLPKDDQRYALSVADSLVASPTSEVNDFLSALTAPEEPLTALLRKRPEQLTNDERNTAHRAVMDLRSSDPRRVPLDALVRGSYSYQYGDDPQSLDETGRPIPAPVKNPLPAQPQPARDSTGQDLMGELLKLGHKVADAAGQDNLGTAISALQAGLNLIPTDRPALKLDGVFGPKSKETATHVIATQGRPKVEQALGLGRVQTLAERVRKDELIPGALASTVDQSFGGLIDAPQPKLQKSLNALGQDSDGPAFTPLQEDGWLGPKTENAFSAAAKQSGPDGVAERLRRDFGW